MLTENTITKLQQMRLSAIANAFREQQMDPNMASLSFEDRFGPLVNQKWTPRKSNHLRKLIQNAGQARLEPAGSLFHGEFDAYWLTISNKFFQVHICYPLPMPDAKNTEAVKSTASVIYFQQVADYLLWF